MKKKIAIVQKVERKRNERKMSVKSGDDNLHSNREISVKRAYVINLRKLDREMKKFELID
jgi:hypothetical protein